MHAEIQVRTIIQHAWSAISHFIQYKQETAVPSHLQRRLYRIASLFELADEEFIGIRNQKSSLKASAAKAIAEGKKEIPLSSSAISEAIKAWSERDAAQKAATDAGFYLIDDNTSADASYIGYIYNLATKLNIMFIDDLLNTVNNVDKKVLRDIFIANNHTPWGINDEFLFYMLLVAAAKDYIDAEYLAETGWSRSLAETIVAALKGEARPGKRKKIAREIKEALKVSGGSRPLARSLNTRAQRCGEPRAGARAVVDRVCASGQKGPKTSQPQGCH